MDKARLTEYDSILLVDKSGSMAEPAPGFGTRWGQARELTVGIATFAAQVDEDGITVIPFGGGFNPASDVIDGVKDAAAVSELFSKYSPAGTTPTAEALQAAFDKKFASGKKAIIICVTDGVPNDAQAVKKVIVDASQKLADASDVRVLFLQVGNDAGAAAFLDDLDNNLTGAKFDIVNAISFKGADGLTVEQLFERAIEDSHATA